MGFISPLQIVDRHLQFLLKTLIVLGVFEGLCQQLLRLRISVQAEHGRGIGRVHPEMSGQQVENPLVPSTQPGQREQNV